MKQPAQYSAQMALMGAPSTPAPNYQQPHFVGSQTISRSSNLHKQLYAQAQAQAAANRCSIYQQAVPARGYLYYEQPASGHQVPPHPLYAPPGQAHTLHRYSYAPMSLALRAPRERGSIPVPMMQQAVVYQQPARRPDAETKQARLEEQKRAPAKMIYQEPTANLIRALEHQARLNKPLCRCRVMYLGSSVPHITKNGLHGIQEPLRHLYPEEQFHAANLRQGEKVSPTSAHSNAANPPPSQTIDISHLSSSLGIDSWLSVWSNGLLLENVDEFGRDVRRFYSIESLHYCAAVRFFDTSTLMQATSQTSATGQESDANNNLQQAAGKQQAAAQQEASRRGVVRFLPLDAPIFQYPGMMDANHPPVFAAIMRRTSGIKVLECHAFICRRDAASNALVRCCTHAYSDFLSAKRLSADFGFLQQQQASAYLGHTTADHEQLARGQTLPSSHSRRLRSASAGRHGKASRGPPEGGQYQVIEVIRSQHERPINGHESAAQRRRRPRHPPTNSTGTNSNELTHSESLNSAEESEPEDDYAIIPKSSSTLNNCGLASRKVLPAQHGAGRDRSSRRRGRKVKGSSKSLFKDFMPPALERQPESGHELDIEKLSHSLDYLAMLNSQQLTADSSQLTRTRDLPAHKSDYDEPSHEFATAQSDTMYSLVSTKNRRHSRSMQNLVQQQASHPQDTSMRQKRASRPGAKPSTGGRKGSLSRANRRSASLQDIMGQQQQQQQLEAPPVPPSPSSLASLSRRSSLRSSIARHSQTGRHDTSGAHINQNGSQHQQEGSRRILRPDCCTSKSTSRSQSRSGSSKRSRCKRRNQENEVPFVLDQSLSPDLHQTSLGYGQPAPVHLQSLYNPMLGSPAPPPPQQALYMPPAAFYGQPAGAPLYSSSSIYDTVTPPPGPFMPLPFVHSQYHHPHPQQQQQLFFPAPPMSAPAHADYLMPTAEPTTSTRAKGKPKSKSATLATRFRCLSPPLNFFSSPSQQTRQLAESCHASQNGPRAEREEHAPSLEEELEKPDVTRGEIVSAQPGFISNQSGEPAAPPARVSSAGRKQKVSWIKRLSMTLSAGGSASQASARALTSASRRGPHAGGLDEAPAESASGADSVQVDSEAGPQLARVPENSRPNEAPNSDGGGDSDGQSLAAQQWAPQPAESGGHQMDGFQQAEEQLAGEPEMEPRPEPIAGQEKKTKRKRTGLFSGALTLGRSAGQRRAQAGKIVT